MPPGPALDAWLRPVFADPPHLLGGARCGARLRELDAERVLVYSAAICVEALRNGGFWQYFRNSAGNMTPEAADGLALLGLGETAGVLRAARDRLPVEKGSLRSREARQAALDTLVAIARAEGRPEPVGAAFDDLDDAFLEVCETENGGFYRAAEVFAAVRL